MVVAAKGGYLGLLKELMLNGELVRGGPSRAAALARPRACPPARLSKELLACLWGSRGPRKAPCSPVRHPRRPCC